MWCTSSTFGVSSEHLNYKKHPLVRALYRFHLYYHASRVLKRLHVPLPYEAGVNAADSPHTSEEFFKVCEDYGVPQDSIRYRDKKILLDLSARCELAR